MRKSDGGDLAIIFKTMVLIIDILLLISMSYYRNQAFRDASYKQNLYSQIAVSAEAQKSELTDCYLYNEKFNASPKLINLLNTVEQRGDGEFLKSLCDSFNKEIKSEESQGEQLTLIYNSIVDKLNEIENKNLELISEDVVVFKYDGIEVVLILILIFILFGLFATV